MELNVIAYLILLLLVAFLRFYELRISRRHRERMSARGASRVAHEGFGWMVVVHTGVLIGSALEVLLLRRPFYPIFGTVCLVIFLSANLVRWWVIRTLGEYWTMQVMNSTALGVVVTGPFRYVRHPNYTAVFVELVSLPLIHCAWITALASSLFGAVALSQRVSAEERMLLADARYRSAMSQKPRFVPGLF